MKRGLMFGFLFCVVLLAGVVSASGNVAYVYRNFRMVDDAFVSAFGEMGLSVDLVDDKSIGDFNFSGYEMIFVGDERFRNLKYLPEMSIVVANGYYGEDLGFIDGGRISKLSSNMPLSVELNPMVQVYDRASFKLGSRGISYYYIPSKYQRPDAESVARTPIGYKRAAGDVISYLPKKCFFGIVDAKYWTDDAKGLFEDCVNHVLGGYVPEPVNDSEPVEGVHDVEIVEDYANSVGGIRIKDEESDEYLLDSISQLSCNKKYKIDFKTENVGNFTENVVISGVFGDFNWTSTKDELEAGKSTTTGSKTINVTFDSGFYDVEILSWIENDATPWNNLRTRQVEVVCGIH
ncbi:MAG: hypothetical protein V1889_03230 [archaeon]